ncbi:conserved hypothetical protein [Prosthecochloris aestuarii DSM 271]|uniref:DUF1207 domain-containing protein n=1 Tax=Prosthecochloris aestuarii (strain DSM 271 / SK 413) TaxID=290512 RepID=B4S9J5_PROA2|nr:DUF1207 domain-containing protein [Prosthecochloris aestuarii]ACF46665.1 conserved hypothetical protein [Prosthecochloris aestuarii DSM 271]
MLKKITSLLAVILLTLSSIPAAQSAPTLDTLFEPLVADPMEPRIAVMPWLDDDYLQLDIGSSADLYQNDDGTMAFGIDFGTWSLLQRSSNFKFPVDAIDYMFGVNFSMKQQLEESPLPFDEFSARIRLSHISAHFEDGHYDEEAGEWMHEEACPFGIPFTYSREFINILLALSAEDYRVYLGYQYLWHTIPDEINRHSLQAGVELSTPGNTYLAADFKLLPVWDNDLEKTDSFKGTWNLQAGWRLTAIGAENVRIAYNYFNGMSRHGMYFYNDESYSTLGVIVDL